MGPVGRFLAVTRRRLIWILRLRRLHQLDSIGAAMELVFVNKTGREFGVMLEPICDQFQIPPGSECRISFDQDLPLRIDLNEDNFLSIWQEGDVKVEVGG